MIVFRSRFDPSLRNSNDAVFALTAPRIVHWWNEAHVRVLLIGGGVAMVVLAALNATLMFDDLYLVEHVRVLVDTNGVPATIRILFFGYDLGPREYRLYGLSRVLHFGLWYVFGTKAWAYTSFVALTQIASGAGIYALLRRCGIQELTAACLGFLWVMSPFMATTCFHHYSYLILPYQLAIACAFVLQRRLLAALIGVGIALTGEAHLLAVPLLLIAVAFATRSDRGWRDRAIDAAVPIMSMALTVALHRWAWLHLVDYPVAVRRFAFALPTFTEGRQRTDTFFQSLHRGFWKQGQAIIDYAGNWGVILIALASAAAAVAVTRRVKPPVSRNEALMPLFLLALAGASIAVVFSVCILSGQVSIDFPRRFGYVPNTLAVMTVFAALFATRSFVSSVPAIGLIGATAGLALALQLICLPVIRAQDRHIWKVITSAMHVLPYILYPIPGAPHSASAGIRGTNFPEIFESPLTAYWWQSQYSVLYSGARFVGYQAIIEGDQARLVGNGLLAPPIVVSVRSVAVIESVDPPPDWRNQPLIKISILSDLNLAAGSYPP